MIVATTNTKLSDIIHLLLFIIIINFGHLIARGHTKGEPVLGAPPKIHIYIHTQKYIHTYMQTCWGRFIKQA